MADKFITHILSVIAAALMPYSNITL